VRRSCAGGGLPHPPDQWRGSRRGTPHRAHFAWCRGHPAGPPVPALAGRRVGQRL